MLLTFPKYENEAILQGKDSKRGSTLPYFHPFKSHCYH